MQKTTELGPIPLPMLASIKRPKAIGRRCAAGGFIRRKVSVIIVSDVSPRLFFTPCKIEQGFTVPTRSCAEFRNLGNLRNEVADLWNEERKLLMGRPDRMFLQTASRLGDFNILKRAISNGAGDATTISYRPGPERGEQLRRARFQLGREQPGRSSAGFFHEPYEVGGRGECWSDARRTSQSCFQQNRRENGGSGLHPMIKNGHDSCVVR